MYDECLWKHARMDNIKMQECVIFGLSFGDVTDVIGMIRSNLEGGISGVNSVYEAEDWIWI